MNQDKNSYRTSLRRIRRELKYESRDDLIGSEILIAGRGTIESNITAAFKTKIPTIGKLIQGGFIGKYLLLDLTFELEPQPTVCPTAKLRMLVDFGLLPKTRQEALESDPLAEAEPNNNGLLSFLEDDLDAKRLFLRLYLDPVSLKMPGDKPKRFGLFRLVDQFRKKSFLTDPVAQGNALINRSFPIRYRVTDACITNACSIWFMKHFYM